MFERLNLLCCWSRFSGRKNGYCADLHRFCVIQLILDSRMVTSDGRSYFHSKLQSIHGRDIARKMLRYRLFNMKSELDLTDGQVRKGFCVDILRTLIGVNTILTTVSHATIQIGYFHTKLISIPEYVEVPWTTVAKIWKECNFIINNFVSIIKLVSVESLLST